MNPEPAPATLASALQYARTNNDLVTVCRGLTNPVDPKRFGDLLKRIDFVVNAKRPNGSKKKKKTWLAQQNKLKGDLFENLVGLVLKSSTVFDAYHSVQTSTNELDWLVMLGPFHVYIPVLRTWGTHFICECKMTKKALDTNWVTRLYALTQTHNTRVAVLLTAKEAGNKGNSSRTLTSIREYSLIPSPGFILRISLGEIETCVVLGQSILEIISEKYMQLALRTERLRILGQAP
jgi:hypothetical protein